MALVGPSSVLVCLALTVVGCLLGATVLYPVVVGCTGARRDSIEAVPEAQAGVDGSADRVAAIAVWHPSRLTPGDAFGTTAVTDAMVVTGPIAQSLWASIDRCRRGDEGLLLECSPDRMLQAVLLDGGEKQVGLSSREACGRMVVVDGRWHGPCADVERLLRISEEQAVGMRPCPVTLASTVQHEELFRRAPFVSVLVAGPTDDPRPRVKAALRVRFGEDVYCRPDGRCLAISSGWRRLLREAGILGGGVLGRLDAGVLEVGGIDLACDPTTPGSDLRWCTGTVSLLADDVHVARETATAVAKSSHRAPDVVVPETYRATVLIPEIEECQELRGTFLTPSADDAQGQRVPVIPENPVAPSSARGADDEALDGD